MANKFAGSWLRGGTDHRDVSQLQAKHDQYATNAHLGGEQPDIYEVLDNDANAELMLNKQDDKVYEQRN